MKLGVPTARARGVRLGSVLVAALSALVAPVNATQPPDVVASDAYHNTAMGDSALLNLTKGTSNTAAGFHALETFTSGTGNTAFGANALVSSSTGNYNTGLGLQALYSATTGSYNSACGANALVYNTTGSYNAALGTFSLESNTTGSSNTAVGYDALLLNSTGSNNLALGNYAGYWATTGNYNIHIGAPGYSGDSKVIRVGDDAWQTQTYVAGIKGAQVTGSAVYISAGGQLGVLASSERFKTEIAAMGRNSEKLSELRPVTFRLRNDPNGPVQYGLLAEEVDKVYPELVLHDADGQVAGVRYEELAPMLLNEVQQQRRQLAAQAAQLAALEETIAAQVEVLQMVRQFQGSLAMRQLSQ